VRAYLCGGGLHLCVNIYMVLVCESMLAGVSD